MNAGPEPKSWGLFAALSLSCAVASWGGLEYVLGYVPSVRIADLFLLAGGVFAVLALKYFKKPYFRLFSGAAAAAGAAAGLGGLEFFLGSSPVISLSAVLLLAAGVFGVLTVLDYLD